MNRRDPFLAVSCLSASPDCRPLPLKAGRPKRSPAAAELDAERWRTALAGELFNLAAAPLLQIREDLTELEVARRRAAAESDEVRSEGRNHFNTRPDRNE